MDSTFITAAVQKEWNLWNVRGFMILSLCLQLVLSIAAPLRQKTSNPFVIFVVWSSYLIADWSAFFVFGLTSNAGCRHSENNGVQVPPDVMVLWAAFLLVYLGGPDTITAFSLEDNALWLRHLVGLLAQLSVFLYIFMKTLPNNRLLAPTVLMFVAGVINYGERTRALYLASLENLKRSINKTTILKQRKGSDIFHHVLKGLVVDIMPDLWDCNECRTTIFRYPAVRTLLEGELNLLYEVLYTKIKAANSIWGKIARAITNYSTLVAFILFCLVDKREFLRVDDAITYALFVGVLILQVANIMMLIRSSFRDASLKDAILLTLGQGSLVGFALVVVLSIFKKSDSGIYLFFARAWPNKMGSFNMLFHCFKQRSSRKCQKLGFIWNKLAGEREAQRKHFDGWLGLSVFYDIMEKAEDTFNATRMRELYEARGDLALGISNCQELMPYITGFQYDSTLLIWHIATEVCINIEGEEDEGDAECKTFSKKLSEYMMYLLVWQPKLMSAVAGITHVRFRDTCDEVKLLTREYEVQNMQKFCLSILEKNTSIIKPTKDVNNHTLSVLKDSCRLAKLLRKRNDRWEVIYNVWVELLSYAASHCRVDSHVRLLSEGGEFITLVWMLMALCGICDQFPIERSSEEEDDQEIGCDQFPVERSSEEDDKKEIGESLN